MLTCYITDRTQLPGTESERRARLLRAMAQASEAGVDYIQLREKDLGTRELELLAREALRAVRSSGTARLLINHRTDVALAVEADGVHLRGNDLAASDVRALVAAASPGRRAPFLIAASCHTEREVRLAESHGADFCVLAPIFEKAHVTANGIGLEELRRAARKDLTPDRRVEAGDTRHDFPVFALGGVTLERAALCAAAGARGVAGIRLFQDADDLAALVSELKAY